MFKYDVVPCSHFGSVSASLAMIYCIFNSLADLFVATTIVIATELSIRWNNITGVSSISDPGQIIPLLIGIACVIRVLYGGGRRLVEKTQFTISGVLGSSTNPDANMQDETNGPPDSQNNESAPLELIAASTPLQDPDIASQHLEPGQSHLNCSGLHAPVTESTLAAPYPDLANNTETASSFTPELSSQDEEMQPVPMTVSDATSTSTSISTTFQQSSLTTRTPKKVTVTGSYGGGAGVYYGGGGGAHPRSGG
jgi:hypothetical protein